MKSGNLFFLKKFHFWKTKSKTTRFFSFLIFYIQFGHLQRQRSLKKNDRVEFGHNQYFYRVSNSLRIGFRNFYRQYTEFLDIPIPNLEVKRLNGKWILQNHFKSDSFSFSAYKNSPWHFNDDDGNNFSHSLSLLSLVVWLKVFWELVSKNKKIFLD